MNTLFQFGTFGLIAVVALQTHIHADTLLIRAGTIYPVSHPPISPGQMVIEDGKIKAIGTDLEVNADRVIDLGSAHIYPGLMALNTVLGLVEINAVRATRDHNEVGQFTPEIQSWKAVDPDSEMLPVARANGITHFLPSPGGGRVAGTSGLLAIRPWTVEDMLVKRHAALHVYWPSMDLDLTPKSQFRNPERWKSVEDQVKERDQAVEELNGFFSDAKVFAKAMTPESNATDSHPAWVTMSGFLNRQGTVLVHADERRQILSAMKWADQAELSIAIAGGRDAWMCAEELAKRNIPVLFEHVFTLPARDRDGYDVHYSAPGVLAEAGVKLILGFGRDAMEAANARNLPYHAAQAVAYGLKPEAALKSITLHPAQVLGVEDSLGSLEPGKEATFFASTDSILDIRSQVTRMWIQGQEVDLDSKHKRLFNRYQSRPRVETRE